MYDKSDETCIAQEKLYYGGIVAKKVFDFCKKMLTLEIKKSKLFIVAASNDMHL